MDITISKFLLCRYMLLLIGLALLNSWAIRQRARCSFTQTAGPRGKARGRPPFDITN